MKKYTYKFGDIVKVNKPLRFIRCGYPMTLDDGIDFLQQKEPKILKFLKEIGLLNEYAYEIPHKLKNSLAYEYIKSKKFGGQSREINVRAEYCEPARNYNPSSCTIQQSE